MPLGALPTSTPLLQRSSGGTTTSNTTRGYPSSHWSSSSRRRSHVHAGQRLRQQPVRRVAASANSSTDATAGSSSPASLEAVIADVLNANKAPLQRPSDLLARIDAAGHGLHTVVRRSWDTTSVRLALEGAWQGAPQARKMAMLAAYQERWVTRAGVLLRLLRWLAASERGDEAAAGAAGAGAAAAGAGMLDASVLQQVEALAAADDINPAVTVLMVPQLTLVAAALLPWPVLLRVIEGAMQEARQVLFSKPPYSYSESQRAKAQTQLQWVEASLCRGAALARLKALLLQQGQLQAWQARAAGAAAAAGGVHLQGLTGEQAYHEHWKQQQQQGTAGGSSGGRPMYVSFHARRMQAPWLQTTAPGLACTSSSASSSSSDSCWDAACVAAEQEQVCRVISQLTQQVQQLKQQMGTTDAALGVLPQVQNAHRAALLDLLVAWAEASPAVGDAARAPVLSGRVAISSIEHDRLLRRIAIEASGPEVPVLRQLAASKGVAFMSHFSPTVGNPFAGTPEWDYFRECPGVFARFVDDPPTETATLTLKALDQQQQQQGVDVVLSASELQQLQRELLRVLAGMPEASGSSSSNSGRTAAAAASSQQQQPGSRSVRLRPLGTRNGTSSSSDFLLGGLARLELKVGGAPVGQLHQPHIVSLITVMEDLLGQLPEQYGSGHQQQQQQQQAVALVTQASPLGQALRDVLSWASRAGRAAAAAALLALPLIAMARPLRGLQLLPPGGNTVTMQAAGSSTSDASSSSLARQQPPPQQQAELLNTQLSGDALQQLCDVVAARVAGRVWLPRSQAGVGAETAARILSTSPLAAAAAAAGIIPSSSSDAQPPAQQQQGPLLFQVVADRAGAVLGLTPCSPAAAAVLWELPLAVDLRGPQLAKVHDRRLAAIVPPDAAGGGGGKKQKPPAPSRSQLGYDPVQQAPLPAEGVAVLRLQLVPAAVTGAGGGGSRQQQGGAAAEAASAAPVSPPQQQQPEGGVRVVGSGKAAADFWLMEALVAPWSDADSLAVWASRGAVLQDDAGDGSSAPQAQGQPASAAAAAAQSQAQPQASSGGLALSLDGQPVESLEAFMQQLLAQASQQQQQQQ